ncbi:PadR family transcriptional regulator [Candidatus Bipolaricaulota bacterium]
MILEHAILGLLSTKAATGYELKKRFDRSIRHFWTADQSHIYRVLSRLLGKGYVTSEFVPQQSKPNRKVYHITEVGRAELTRWLVSGEAMCFSAREPLLVRLFFLGIVPDEDVLDVLCEEVDCASGFLAEYEEISERSLEGGRKKPSREHFFRHLTVDYGIWMQHALIDWLAKTMGRIERGEADRDDWPQTFPSGCERKAEEDSANERQEKQEA